LTFIDEALTELFQLDEAIGGLLEHLDVFASRQLPFLLDSLFTHILANLVGINVRIILANFAHKSLSVLLGLLQKYFFSLKDFFLYSFGCFNVKHAG